MIYLRRDVSFLALNSYQELPVHLNEKYSNLQNHLKVRKWHFMKFSAGDLRFEALGMRSIRKNLFYLTHTPGILYLDTEIVFF